MVSQIGRIYMNFLGHGYRPLRGRYAVQWRRAIGIRAADTRAVWRSADGGIAAMLSRVEIAMRL